MPRLPLTLGLTVLKIGLLVAVTFVVGGRAIPWLLARVAESKSRELFTLTVLVVALGIAVGSALLFGVSMPCRSAPSRIAPRSGTGPAVAHVR